MPPAGSNRRRPTSPAARFPVSKAQPGRRLPRRPALAAHAALSTRPFSPPGEIPEQHEGCRGCQLSSRQLTHVGMRVVPAMLVLRQDIQGSGWSLRMFVIRDVGAVSLLSHMPAIIAQVGELATSARLLRQNTASHPTSSDWGSRFAVTHAAASVAAWDGYTALTNLCCRL